MAGKVTEANKLRVWRRDRLRCHYCGCACSLPWEGNPDSPSSATIDHVIPQCDGGSNKLNNLVTACWSCNSAKGCRHVFDPNERFRPLPPLVHGDATRELARRIVREQMGRSE